MDFGYGNKGIASADPAFLDDICNFPFQDFVDTGNSVVSLSHLHTSFLRIFPDLRNRLFATCRQIHRVAPAGKCSMITDQSVAFFSSIS